MAVNSQFAPQKKNCNLLQFVIFYQPKFNIQGGTPKLVSAETFVRWKHPQKGLISPGIFIPLFEEKGLIQQLDLFDPALVETLLDIVKENSLENKDLLLEITESACTSDVNAIIEKASALREAGFKIEIDDFGTGYSSLSMINKLPFDALKIDMILFVTPLAVKTITK